MPLLPPALRRSLVGAAVVTVTTTLVAPAAAAPLTTGPARSEVTSSDAVGGPRLGAPGTVVGAGSPALPDVAADSWLVADLDTGEVLAAKDPHGKYAPASTLKVLTAVTLIPELDRDQLVVPTFDDVAVEGSKVGLVEQVSYPVHELFSALLMVSGNDAANALATAAGGQEAAAHLMNARAAELGALDTRAVNQHGLDAEGQVSSAYDLALIARAGMADPQFAAYVATRQSSVAAPDGARLAIANKNKLLRGYPGALGIKNGFTSTARASFVGAAERDGRRLVVTLMKASPQVFDEAAKLLDWGFSAPADQPIGELVPDAALSEAALPAQAGPTTSAAETTTRLAPTTEAVSGRVVEEGASLAVALAGLALAAAALLAVSRRPAPRPAGPRAARPAGRPTPRSTSPRSAPRPVPRSEPRPERSPNRVPVARRRVG